MSKRTHLGGFIAGAIAMASSHGVAGAAPSEQVLYSFADGMDGGGPDSRLVFDRSGNVFGTAHFGGITSCGGQVGGGCGVVFKLTPAPSPPWTETTLHAFADGSDGGFPNAGVILDRKGNVYGTASTGGSNTCSIGCGLVFELLAGSGYTETVLHTFTGVDGQFPNAVLLAGSDGNLYTTTWFGGAHGSGTVVQLVPGGNGWTENVLYSFMGTTDGLGPAAGVVQNARGDVFGTTYPYDGYNDGVVYELTHNKKGTWKDHTLLSFGNGTGGSDPYAGLVAGGDGSFFGTTIEGGSTGDGVIFELVPRPNGTWKERVLHTFSGADGATPYSGLSLDKSGNLFGATLFGGSGNAGTLYEMLRGKHGYTFTPLYSFTGGADGKYPQAEPIVGHDGNLYGTAEEGGTSGNGVVYELKL
jgi:uncharacterized repeat protein (TIGR03803 family)